MLDSKGNSGNRCFDSKGTKRVDVGLRKPMFDFHGKGTDHFTQQHIGKTQQQKSEDSGEKD